MDEKTSALDALPYPLLLEIAFYLDIDSLIALSEVRPIGPEIWKIENKTTGQQGTSNSVQIL